ncbi:MAG: T9SS type A sorting domain-containing protein [Candidatus Hydrothermales bacterium]
MLDPGSILIIDAANAQYGASVDGDGTRFLIAWQDYRNGANWDLYATFLDPVTGSLSHPSGFPIMATGSHSVWPKVTFHPVLNRYGVAFMDNTPGYYQIYGCIIRRDATIALAPKRITTTTTNDQFGFLVPLYNKNFLLAVTQGYSISASGEVYVGITDSLLNMLGIQVLTSTTYNEGYENYTLPFATTLDSVIIIGYNVYHSGNYQEVGIAKILPTLTVRFTDFYMGWQAPSQSGIRAARAGDRLIVVYSQVGPAGNLDIYGRIYSFSGLPLTGPFVISSAAHDQRNPVVTYNPVTDNFVCVWEDYRNGNWDIYGTRISPSGVVIDPAGFSVVAFTQDQLRPSIAVSSLDGNFFVSWSDYRAGWWDLYGKLFSSTGSPLTGDLILSNAGGTQDYSTVTFIPAYNRYFIIYETDQNGRWDLYFNAVSGAGSVLYGSGGSPLFTLYSQKRFPSSIFNGINIVLTWSDYRSGNWDIYAARVSPFGALLDGDGIPVSRGSWQEAVSTVVNLGDHLLIIWQDSRSGRMDIYGKILDFTLNQLPEEYLLSNLRVNGFIFSPNDYPIQIANLVPLTDSTFALVYERFKTSPYNNKRAHIILFRDNSPSFSILPFADTFLYTNQVANIRWTTRGLIERVSLLYSPDNCQNFFYLKSDTLNTGNFNYIVPQTPTRNFFLKLESRGMWNIFRISRRLYVSDKIDITYPNSLSDTLQIGNSYIIKWKKSGIGGFVKIEISYDGGSTFSIIESACPDTGEYLWNCQGIPTNNAVLRITHNEFMQNRDVSGKFVIKGIQPPSPYIQVLNPNTRITKYVGDTLNIRWSYANVNNFRILLTPDSSLSYVVISPSISGTSNYVWTVSNYETPFAKIRVENLNDPLIYDESDDYFIIKQPILITSPSTGDTFLGGSNLNITWSILEPRLVDTVDIFISYDGGKNFLLIGNDIEASQSSFSFLLPNQNYDSCKIKIVHHKREWLIKKESEGYFKIIAALNVSEKDAKELFINCTYDKDFILLYLDSDRKLSFEIYDTGGRKVLKGSRLFEKGENKIDLKGLRQGLYILKVYHGKDQIYESKFIKVN